MDAVNEYDRKNILIYLYSLDPELAWGIWNKEGYNKNEFFLYLSESGMNVDKRFLKNILKENLNIIMPEWCTFIWNFIHREDSMMDIGLFILRQLFDNVVKKKEPSLSCRHLWQNNQFLKYVSEKAGNEDFEMLWRLFVDNPMMVNGTYYAELHPLVSKMVEIDAVETKNRILKQIEINMNRISENNDTSLYAPTSRLIRTLALAKLMNSDDLRWLVAKTITENHSPHLCSLLDEVWKEPIFPEKEIYESEREYLFGILQAFKKNFDEGKKQQDTCHFAIADMTLMMAARYEGESAMEEICEEFLDVFPVSVLNFLMYIGAYKKNDKALNMFFENADKFAPFQIETFLNKFYMLRIGLLLAKNKNIKVPKSIKDEILNGGWKMGGTDFLTYAYFWGSGITELMFERLEKEVEKKKTGRLKEYVEIVLNTLSWIKEEDELWNDIMKRRMAKRAKKYKEVLIKCGNKICESNANKNFMFFKRLENMIEDIDEVIGETVN